MIRKEIRNEREANLALQARELPVMTFHPNFLKPMPKRNPYEIPQQEIPKQRYGRDNILQTFAKLLGR